MSSDGKTTCLHRAMVAARVVTYSCEGATGHTYRSENSMDVIGVPSEGPTERWLDLIDPEDRPDFDNALHSARPEQPRFDVEYRITHAVTGRRFWVLDRGECAYDSSGTRTHVYGAIVDINARMGSEMALRKSTQMNAVAFEAARMAAWHLDIAADILNCSDELIRLLHIEQPTAGSDAPAIESTIHPADRDIWRKAFREDLVHAGRMEAEFRVIHQPGDIRWFLLRGETTRHFAGRPREAYGVMLDITERKAAEEAVARLAAIVTNSDDAILSKSLTGILTSWNRGAEQLFGYAAEEVIGKSVQTIIPPENADEENRILSTIRAGDSVLPYETVRLRKDGSTVHVSIAVSPIRRARGDVVGASTIARDVTERRRYTEALRQNEARLRLALRSARAGAWDMDLVRNQVHWSQEMYLLYGIDQGRGIPSREDLYGRIPAEHRARAKAEFNEALQKGGSFTVEFPIVRPDGSTIWTAIIGDVVKDEMGKSISARGIDQDITERKNWEVRQATLLRELSHRVKNTLAVIQSMTRQTLRANEDPRTFVEAFEGRIRSLAASHNLLTEIDWGNAKLPVVIRNQLEGMVESMESRFTLRGPDVVLSADVATQLGLVLHELGTNAAKYGALSRPDGHIDIVWTTLGGKLRLSWRERGGPPIEKLPSYSGFGSALLLSSTTKVTRHFARAGLTCRLEFAL